MEGEAKITTDPFISIPDLVSRLRNYPWLTTAAANEIERLRKENDDLKEIVALQGEVVKLAQKRHEERDGARRELCAARRELCRNEAIIRLQRHRVHRDSEDVVGLAKEIAVERGWDCFKDNP